MILKKFHFPIFFLILMLLYSCEEKNSVFNISKKKQYDTLINRAFKHLDKQKYDSAFFYYNKAKFIFGSENNEYKTYALLGMASVQRKQNDFFGSETTITEALKSCTSPKYLPVIYNELGISYGEQSNYEEAIKYYNKCFNDSLSIIDQDILKNNIAVIYLEKKDYKRAENILKPLISQKELKTKPLEFAKITDNFGFAQFKLHNTHAIDHLTLAAKIRDSIGDEYEKIASFMHLADYYLKEKPSLSLSFARKALTSATVVNSPDDKLEAMKFLISASPLQDAKQLALQQITLSDSITKVRNNAKNQFAKIKFDSSIALKESEKQRSEKQLYFSLFLFISTLSIFSFFAIRSRNKRKLQAATYETETRISKRLHDELANDVFNVMTFAETQNLENETNKEQFLDQLDTIYSRTRNIAKENSDIDTGIHFQRNLIAMISSYISPQTNIIIREINAVNWLELKKETKITLFRILQELLVNMKKHSACSIAIIGFENKKRQLEINYSDNGKGANEMLKLKNGLQNAENRIRAIKGTITFETETQKGFKAKLIFPK